MNKIIKWLAFVLAALSPIVLDGVIYRYIGVSIFAQYTFIGYLLFASLILSVDVLRQNSFGKIKGVVGND
jgi:hypothetical protein